MGIAADIVVLVVGALGAALIAVRLGQPPLVGYMIAGVLLGPNAFGFITDANEIELLAEIGVSLLMFSLGLQLQLKELIPVRRVAGFGTLIQMLLTIAFGGAISFLFGWRLIEGIWFGALLALSSTVVTLKILQGKGLLGTLSSRVMIGIMIVQDLAFIPLLLILPQLNDISTGLPQLGFAALRAVGFILVMYFVGIRLLPRLLDFIAGWQNRELFLVGVTAIGLGVGYVTFLFGLSFAFGAFVAGTVLGESEYGVQALGDVIPLRDLFSLLFFASVGMLIDPLFVWQNLPMILGVTVVASLGKALILGGTVYAFGYRNVIPLAIGLTMFQIGEFSFVLARTGLDVGAYDADFFSMVLSVAVLTIMLTPSVAGLIPRLYAMQQRLAGGGQTQETVANMPKEGLENHVIIAGGGDIGRYVASVLKQTFQPFVVIEMNPEAVARYRAAGIPVIYGDAGHPVVLEAANFRKSCLLVDTVPNIQTSEAILDYIRHSGSDLHVVARAESISEIERLHDLGVYEAVMPQFEAGIELVRQSLLHLGVDNRDIRRLTIDCRTSFYLPIREPDTEAEAVPTSVSTG
jgi:CPA2 family monovalent cation:H+ antiporter-2